MATNKDKWSITGTLEDWSRIISENQINTKRFINFVKANFVDVKVTSVSDPKNNYEALYTLTDTFNKQKELEREDGCKDAVSRNRHRMIEDIIHAYHPAKMRGKNSKFRNEFIKLMQDTSRGVKQYKDRIELETAKGELILSHINFLKTTPEWNDPTLLKTLDEYLLSDEWNK
jgi:hypothetical protein